MLLHRPIVIWRDQVKKNKVQVRLPDSSHLLTTTLAIRRGDRNRRSNVVFKTTMKIRIRETKKENFIFSK